MDLIKKQGNLRLPAKATLFYITSGFLTKAIGFISTPIFTRILSTEDYGVYSYYMSFLGVVTILCSPAASGGIIYKGLSDNDLNESDLLLSGIGIFTCFSLVICTLLFAFSAFFAISRYFVILIFVQSICDGVIGIYLLKCKFRYLYRTAICLSLTEALLSPLLAFLLIRGAGLGYEGRIFGLLFPALLIASPIFVFLAKEFSKGKFIKSTRYVLRNSISLIPQSISTAVITQADKLILATTLGASLLARYSVAHSVGAAVGFISTAVCSAFHPWVIRRIKLQRFADISNAVRLVFSSLGAITLFVVALSPEIMKFLAPSDYYYAAYAIFPISFSTLPALLSGLSTIGLILSGHRKFSAIPALFSAFLNLILCIVLIPEFSLIGAGIALLISEITLALGNLLLLRRANLSEMIKWKNTAKDFLIFFIIGAILSSLSSYPTIRILILIYPSIILINSAIKIQPMIFET